MATQIYDSNGLPVISPDAVANPDQQVADSSGFIIDPATKGAQTAVQGTVAPGTAATKSVLIGGVYSSTPPSLTNGQQAAFQFDASGNLKSTAVLSTTSLGVLNSADARIDPATEGTLAKLTLAQSTALGSNTQAMVGGAVSTASPTYTSGNINPLSLDTTGALRTTLKSAAATGSTPPTTANQVGGTVTTAAPSYTNNTLAAISLDTTGALRTGTKSEGVSGATAPGFATLIGGVNDAGNIVAFHADNFAGEPSLQVLAEDRNIYDTINGRTYRCSIEATLATTAEINFFHLRNPLASGKSLILDRLVLDVVTKGGQVTCRVYDAATITGNGTAATIKNGAIGGGFGAGVGLTYTAPTTSALGAKIASFSGGVNSNSLIYDFDGLMLMAPGTDLIFTGVGDANGRVISLTAIWREI